MKYACPCGELLPSSTGRPTKRHMHCAQCEKPMHVSPTSLPQGEARCRPCRQLTPRPKPPKKKSPCVDCGQPSYGERCRSCNDTLIAGDPIEKRRRKAERAIRVRREFAAPGLTKHERRMLGQKWKRQGRRCSYCPAPAVQVDHVIPLALGGTNYEGNLAPACASCNFRKSDSLLIEWKNKIRVARQHPEPPPMPQRAARKQHPKRVPQRPLFVMNTCEWCAELFAAPRRRRFCDKRCNDESTKAKRRIAADAVRGCEDCCGPVDVGRKKCDRCVAITKRMRKRRERRSEYGRRARREYERRRYARRKAQRQVGGRVAA